MTVRPNVSVRILRGLNGLTDSVTAFNDSDVVVGIQELGFAHHAFDWTATAGMQLLSVTTGWNSEAWSINDPGNIAGDVSTGPWLLPVHWPPANSMVTMEVLNPGDSLLGVKPGCVARGINANGVMTGDCYDPIDDTWYVTLWNSVGDVQAICAPLDCFLKGHGLAINSRGVVAGGPALDFWNLNAFAFFPGVTVDTLPKLVTVVQNDVASDQAFAINTAGVLAGSAWTGANINDPCVWDPAVWRSPFQKPIDIGPQLCGRASGIDNNNVVIGTVTVGGTQAFIWTQTTGIQALPGLGGTNESSAAVAINNKREVLGSIVSSGTKYDVIWTF